jgi:hypothetical protein
VIIFFSGLRGFQSRNPVYLDGRIEKLNRPTLFGFENDPIAAFAPELYGPGRGFQLHRLGNLLNATLREDCVNHKQLKED